MNSDLPVSLPPPKSQEPLVRFARCFRNVKHDADVRQLIAAIVSDPASGTPTEAALVRELVVALDPDERAGLADLVIRIRHGEDVDTAGRRRARDEATRLRVESERTAEAEHRAAQIAVRARAAALARLDEVLECDYLNAGRIFQSELAGAISAEEFQQRRVTFVRDWTSRHTNHQPDLDQAAAIGASGHNVLLTARAGSGKTLVLVSRALFLMCHCGVPADSLLLLAFNRKAAKEMQQRITGLLAAVPSESARQPSEGHLPHVSTFHSLAYALVAPAEKLIYDDPDDPSPEHSGVVQEVLDAHCAESVFIERVRMVMLDHFRRDLDQDAGHELGLPDSQRLELRRSMPQITLAGERVKSFGEKVIANFLFERGVPYSYERAMRWNGRPYRPDFTVDRADGTSLIVEYFGMDAPDYQRQRQDKRNWLSGKGIPLVEIEPHDVAGRTAEQIEQVLSTVFEAHMALPPRLSEDEIWQRCRELAVLEISRALRGFVSRCRQQWITPEALDVLAADTARQHPELAGYLGIASTVYRSYLTHLSETGMDDFAGLMQRAVSAVDSGETAFVRRQRAGDLRRMQHVLIDEFQDFSELFYRLVRAIRSARPDVDVFAVGDDWQAINGFAGSDLRFFEDFEAHLGPVERAQITRNYRSRPAVVAVGNDLMCGRGAPAVPTREPGERVRFLDIDVLVPTSWEHEVLDAQIAAIGALRVASWALQRHDRVHLLSRTDTTRLDSAIKVAFSREERERIRTSTVHKYKGRESECIILADAIERRYPLIHPNWVFDQVFATTLQQVVDEERRLLYVALTRAVDALFVVTSRTVPSPFLTFHGPAWTPMTWEGVAPLTDPSGRESSRITVIGHGTYAMREQLKAARFRWNPHERLWYRSEGSRLVTLAELQTQPWAEGADDVVVSIAVAGTTQVFSVRAGSWHSTTLFP